MHHDDALTSPVQVKVLYGSCADDETCTKITDIGDPEWVYVITEKVDDPAILAAHARHMNPATEQLGRYRRSDLPGGA